jgi:hypothetical protein
MTNKISILSILLSFLCQSQSIYMMDNPHPRDVSSSSTRAGHTIVRRRAPDGTVTQTVLLQTRPVVLLTERRRPTATTGSNTEEQIQQLNQSLGSSHVNKDVWPST